MVKTVKIFLLSVTLVLTSCKKEHAWDCFMSKGGLKSENRTSGAFEHIELSSNIDLILTYAPGQSEIKVSAGKNLIPGIRTEIREGRLVIWNENKCNWVRTYDSPLTVEVTISKLKSVVYFGTGKIRSTNTIKSDSLKIEVWGGSGNIDLDVDNRVTIVAMHTGVADVRLNGLSYINHIWVAGNGYYNGYGLESEYNYVQHFGTGECKIVCKSELGVKLFSSGDIKCKGNPPHITSEIHSTGKLILE